MALDLGKHLVQVEYVKRSREPILNMRWPASYRRKFARGPIAAGRRQFMTLGAALAGSALFSRRAAAESYPPQEPPWSKALGPGVVDRPYGRPSQFVKDVIRRNVPWLTATRESSVSFAPLQDLSGIITPNGLFFERHHSGRADIDPHLIECGRIFAEANIGKNRPALLRKPHEVEDSGAFAFEMRGHRNDRADRHDAGAADAADEKVVRAPERRQSGIGQGAIRP